MSVTRPLHVRKLTVLCPLLVWHVCAPYDFPDDFDHRINIFFHFFLSIRRLLPVSVDM